MDFLSFLNFFSALNFSWPELVLPRYTDDLPADAHIIQTYYYLWPLLLLSYLLACLAANTALSTVERAITVKQNTLRRLWVIFGGISLGTGIWAMHFTAVEAFRVPIPIHHDITLSLLSWLAAVTYCWLSLALYSTKQSLGYTLLASLLMATGIIVMHFTGMAAMRMPAQFYYDLSWFLGTIAVAAVTSFAALLIARYFSRKHGGGSLYQRLWCSMAIGVAIAATHFTGMGSAKLAVVGDLSVMDLGPSPVSTQLILAVVTICTFVMMLAIIVGESQRRFQLSEQHLEEVNALVAQLESAQQSLQEVALFDPVTRLKNRYALNQELERTILKHQNQDAGFTLLFIDIDNFKRINDSLGHACGDQLLLELTKRMQSCLRGDDLIARFGGDEFVIILQATKPESVRDIANRLRTTTLPPFIANGLTVQASISIGIALYPQHGTDAGALLRNADIALYRAKEQGKNCYAIFSNQMHTDVNRHLSLENELRKAIAQNTVTVHYQPLVRSDNNRIVAIEALARWTCGGEIISPSEFIGVAEDSGLIVSLGKLIMAQALNTLKELSDAGYSHLKLYLNLSPLQLQDQSLPATMQALLGDTGIAGERINVEITESCIVNSLEMIRVQVERLKELGIGISIDDFGTGYSALSYLKKLPIDSVKIDRTFVSSLPDDPEDASIAEAILDMARRLSLNVVAEGVETGAQASFFRQRSCKYLQGFYFSEPVAPARLPEILKRNYGKGVVVDFRTQDRRAGRLPGLDCS